MFKELLAKLKESFISILPIFVLVLFLHCTITPFSTKMMSDFLIGALFLVIGMSLFTLGANSAMMPMGNKIGEYISKHKKLWFLIVISLLLGTFITLAEPDLKVLADQASYLPSSTLIITVSIGVGMFLVLAALRIIFKLNLSKLLVISYLLIFILAFFIQDKFIPISFDSGGVTTGPITVPFIMALGIGMSSVNGDDARNDSFGLIGLCSIGPILSVLLLSLFYGNGNASYDSSSSVATMGEYFGLYSKEILIALLPIIVFFTIFQIFFLKMSKKSLTKIGVGLIYTFFGLVLFLLGVNYGFMNAGKYIGETIASSTNSWWLIPLGMIMGLLTILAEPAVYVLNKQVEEISSGLISKKSLTLTLSIGVSIAVGLAMTRVVFDVDIMYILLPGYLIALIMTFIAPKMFVAIAFDSGGVASGPMAATFILPFAIGTCSMLGNDIILDAFGLVSFIALTPLISIQILGVVYNIKLNNELAKDTKREVERYIELEV